MKSEIKKTEYLIHNATLFACGFVKVVKSRFEKAIKRHHQRSIRTEDLFTAIVSSCRPRRLIVSVF